MKGSDDGSVVVFVTRKICREFLDALQTAARRRPVVWTMGTAPLLSRIDP
jgi:hypothetical protein